MRFIIEGKVLKAIAGQYNVLINNNICLAVIKGSLKKQIKILIGDNVELVKDDYSNNYVITKILPRKNFLIRPTVANIDQLLIVLAEIPKPDLYLVDKLIIYCNMNNIEPIIIINKEDIATNEFINDIKLQYNNVVKKIIITSTKLNKINELINILSDKVSVFAGQSAVGKSSLLNLIIPNINQETNIVSKKVERGKHTTRVCEIFKYENFLIADTPGFTMLEFNNLKPIDLQKYYTDFANFSNCKFSNCAHINVTDNVCGVIRALNKGQINKQRYNRYVDLYNKLKDKWEKKYD